MIVDLERMTQLRAKYSTDLASGGSLSSRNRNNLMPGKQSLDGLSGDALHPP